jgi:hypothetical protein
MNLDSLWWQYTKSVLLDLDENETALEYISCPIFWRAYYLLVAKIRERLSVSKQTFQKLDKERYDLKNLNNVEVKE